jgi:DNA end-binding protein Ku
MRSNIWKGSISFGLLNIPCSLQTAQADKEIHFSMLDEKGLSRIKFRRVNADTGKEVPYERIVKGYEYKPGHYVVMNEGDFKKANPKATQTIDIEDFALLEDVDLLMFERPYYLVPQKGAEKGYFLLRQALADTKKVAVAKIVIRTKQHLCLIFPRGDYLILELLRFAHQVKEVSEVNYLKEVNKRVSYTQKELKMAEDLIAGMTSKWKPEQYKDTYYSDLMKLIQAKVKQGKGKLVKEPKEEKLEPPTDNVVDLMPLLAKSLAAKKSTRTRKKAASKPALRVAR